MKTGLNLAMSSLNIHASFSTFYVFSVVTCLHPQILCWQYHYQYVFSFQPEIGEWKWKTRTVSKVQPHGAHFISSVLFFSKFGSEMRKQRKSFWAAISSIRSQGFSIWFPFIFDTNGGDKSRKWNGEIKIGSQDNCLESCQTSVGTRPYPFESSL